MWKTTIPSSEHSWGGSFFEKGAGKRDQDPTRGGGDWLPSCLLETVGLVNGLGLWYLTSWVLEGCFPGLRCWQTC